MGAKKEARKQAEQAKAKLAALAAASEELEREVQRLHTLHETTLARLERLAATTESRVAAQLATLDESGTRVARAAADATSVIDGAAAEATHAADVLAGAQHAAVDGHVARVAHAADSAIAAVEQSSTDALTTIDAGAARASSSIDQLMSDADRTLADVLQALHSWSRVAEQRVTAAAESAIGHLEEQATERTEAALVFAGAAHAAAEAVAPDPVTPGPALQDVPVAEAPAIAWEPAATDTQDLLAALVVDDERDRWAPPPATDFWSEPPADAPSWSDFVAVEPDLDAAADVVADVAVEAAQFDEVEVETETDIEHTAVPPAGPGEPWGVATPLAETAAGDDADGDELESDTFTPDTFTPDTFTPGTFTPDTFTPDTFTPDTFTPGTFTPDTFTPDTFTPDTFTPGTPIHGDVQPVDVAAPATSAAEIAAKAVLHVQPGLQDRRSWEADRGGSFTVTLTSALLASSLSLLARSAADGWVRTELTFDALRLTVFDVSGWWEYHDVPVRGTQLERRGATVDLTELLQAVELDRANAGDGTVTLTFDGDLTVGTTLVLGRSAPVMLPAGNRQKIERLDLRGQDRNGLTVNTQLGRFTVPSRLVSLLRSRRAVAVDLMTIGEQPCISAQVAEVAPGVGATILAPLHVDAEETDTGAEERRGDARSPIQDLLGSLSTTASAEELTSIIATGTPYARRRAAAHPALPAEVVDEMLRDGTEAMRAAAASNPAITPESTERAMADDAVVVRMAIAGNPSTGPDALRRLADDADAQVRSRTVANPGLPDDTFRQLVNDASSDVRATVAASDRVSPELFGLLAHDADPAVCAAVAQNPACPVELLDELVGVVPETVLSNPQTPEHLLSAGSQVRSPQLRAAVAANPATPTRVLETLSRDPSDEVRDAVAENPSSSPRARRRARKLAARA